MSDDFTHDEIMDALEQRHQWIMAQLERRGRVTMASVVLCGVAGCLTAVITLSPWSLLLISPAIGCIAWYGWHTPGRLEAQWNVTHAAIGQCLQREGLSR